jgi:hypothetical protein
MNRKPSFKTAETAFAKLAGVNWDPMQQTTTEDLVFSAETELDLYKEGESHITAREVAKVRAFVKRFKVVEPTDAGELFEKGRAILRGDAK